ncbi:MAG TPA: glycosyltransferase family 4 protein [Candidatus Acidoferrum sp.]|nr:glycosyltransferase family 4 protein [Candidatus Acidoferrum sp.]
MGRALQQMGDITLVVVSVDAADDTALRQTTAEFRVEEPVHVELEPNRGLWQRLRWAFDPHYLNVHGCRAGSADRERLAAMQKQFDLVWVFHSRTPNIVGQWFWPHSVLDIDDVPSTFQRTVWQNGASLGEKLKAGVTAMLLKRRELLLKKRFTGLAVCSEADREYLGAGDQVHVIPNGFERPAREPLRLPGTPPRLGFIGLCTYLPNLEGVRWFLNECWKNIKAQVPDARLRLAGKGTDGPLQAQGRDIDALGWIPDADAEIATWSAMIVPVRHGAGTRIKIADAFSRKCPVVSTRLGAFGYEVRNGRELLLADDPAEFARACVSLLREPSAGAAMAQRAFDVFLKNWTWDAIAPRVWAAAEYALQKAGRG